MAVGSGVSVTPGFHLVFPGKPGYIVPEIVKID